MAQWDEETGKLKPTWTVRFSPWWVFLGCAIAGVVCALVLFLTLVTGPGLGELNDAGSVAQGGVLLLGISFVIFILVGPTLAYGVGFALRNNPNHNVHIVAFAVLGVIVGFMLGGLVDLGTVVAPAAGIGAGVGRWAISKHAKI